MPVSRPLQDELYKWARAEFIFTLLAKEKKTQEMEAPVTARYSHSTLSIIELKNAWTKKNGMDKWPHACRRPPFLETGSYSL